MIRSLRSSHYYDIIFNSTESVQEIELPFWRHYVTAYIFDFLYGPQTSLSLPEYDQCMHRTFSKPEVKYKGKYTYGLNASSISSPEVTWNKQFSFYVPIWDQLLGERYNVQTLLATNITTGSQFQTHHLHT